MNIGPTALGLQQHSSGFSGFIEEVQALYGLVQRKRLDPAIPLKGMVNSSRPTYKSRWYPAPRAKPNT